MAVASDRDVIGLCLVLMAVCGLMLAGDSMARCKDEIGQWWNRWW